MNRWRTLRLHAAGSIVIPAAAVLIWRDLTWLNGLFLLWTALAAATWVAADRKEHAERAERATQTLQTAAIRTLNHHRHDWMNDLQVLYGYIRMNKPDKTVECVEKIRERMATESRISKLGIPSLVLFLQSFRTVTNSMQLQFEVADDVNLAELPLDGNNAADALIDLVNAYRFGAKPGHGDVARLSVELRRDESSLIVTVSYAGELLNAEELRDKCRRRMVQSVFQAAEWGPDMKEAVLRADWR